MLRAFLVTPAVLALTLAASPLVASGCVAIGTGRADAGEAGAAGGDAASPDASIGRGCAEDPLTRTTLCTEVAPCPGLAINHDVFPNCGFRVRAGGYDLACWCNGWVCPMGAPTSCAEAERLVAAQSELQVCAQVNEGRCTQPQVTSGASDGGSAKPGCDPACLRECGQAAGCAQLCGC